MLVVKNLTFLLSVVLVREERFAGRLNWGTSDVMVKLGLPSGLEMEEVSVGVRFWVIQLERDWTVHSRVSRDWESSREMTQRSLMLLSG